MNKIINFNQAKKLSQTFRKKNIKIVVCGGCFDILHIGHVRFLESSKNQGDILFVLLESDKNVKKIKGTKRPINSQKDRAEILSSLIFVDFVIMLKNIKTNKNYDNLIKSLNPNVITITKNSPLETHAKRQAKNIGAKVVAVIKNVEDKSTSKFAKIIFDEFN